VYLKSDSSSESYPTIDKRRASVSDAQLQPEVRTTMHPRLRCLSASFKSRRLYSKMTESLVSLPEVEQVSDRVIRVLGGNPSKVSVVII
jgi:hypothetical protein